MLRDNKVLPRSDSAPSGNNTSPNNNNNNINNNKKNNDSSNMTSNPVLAVKSESDEQETLLSKVDNKYINKEFAGNSIYLGACFCPCLFLGHIESKVKREESMLCSCCATSCPRLTFGSIGCQTCCSTAILCALGWPCSPCLTCYLNSKSSSISNIYDRNIKKSCCNIPLLWPKTVLQHVLLHEQLEKEGRLFYDWTLQKDVQMSFQHQQFQMKDTAVLIVGGKNVGKTELLMKLCHRYLYERRDSTFENNEVRVGFRPMTVGTNGQVSTLEFWDIPTLRIQSIHTIRAKVSHILLVYDVNRYESFKEIQKIYKDIQETMSNIIENAMFVVVGAKNDHLYYKTTAEGRWDIDPNQEIIARATTWAHDNNMTVLSTATPFNIGVNEILKFVQKEPQPNGINSVENNVGDGSH